MRIPRTIIIAGALSLALVGCAGPVSPGESPVAQDTASPAPETSATPTPAATPTPSPTANGEAVITTAGYGDLKLNSPVPKSTELVKWDGDFCSENDGSWIPSDGVSDDATDDAYFVVRTKDRKKSGDIEQILIYDPSIETKSGAHIGSTLDELGDLFPELKTVREDEGISGLHSVSDNLGQVIFETMDNTVVDIIIMRTDVEVYGVQSTDGGWFCAA